MTKNQPIISVNQLTKTYQGGFEALKGIDLTIEEGEILALLGPNGAGKTTLISIICGTASLSSGSVTIGGFDNVAQSRKARQLIGLVPQELTVNMFESVFDTVSFSRGLFGLAPNPDYILDLLKRLSLDSKKNTPLMALSGGMKRRVMIAKALAHEPQVLFLDEPTAGVDVNLRKDMWQQVAALRESGVTIILTTHYIEEAEEMADRIGIINNGQLILVEDKAALMKKMGKKQLTVELAHPLTSLPAELAAFNVELKNSCLTLTYDSKKKNNAVAAFFETLNQANLSFQDITTGQNSLEEIFVELVKDS